MKCLIWLVTCAIVSLCAVQAQSIFKGSNRIEINGALLDLQGLGGKTGTVEKPVVKTPPKVVAKSSSRKTPEQERTKLFQSLVIDRSNSGILEERLKVRRAKKTEKPAIVDTKELDKVALLKKYKDDVNQLRSNVVLGNWQAVKEYIETLPDKDASLVYQRILKQLGGVVTVSPRAELAVIGAKSHPQPQYIRPSEIWQLSDVSKKAPTDADITAIAMLVKKLQPLPAEFFTVLEQGTRYFGGKDHATRARTAKLLLAANMVEKAEAFLPDVKEAKNKKDYGSLNLIARFHSEAHNAEHGLQHLPASWDLCLGIISESEAPINERGEALYRALALVPELEGETGKQWLTKTFTSASAEGFEILSAVGTLTAQTREHRSSAFRLKQLELQSAAAKALLNNQTELAEWQEILTLYVRNWNAEAVRSYKKDSSTSLRPQERFDSYGNRYYAPRTVQTRTTPTSVSPIVAADLIKIRADEKWLKHIDPVVRLDFLSAATALLLKVQEDEAAFVLLKQLAEHRPKRAKELVRDMISVWIGNNNPNQNTRYRSRFSHYYGYSQVAQSIPLTRSRQERNLVELSSLIKRVKALGLDDNFEDEFADAFIQSHSQAEVWRLEALEKVFGPVDGLDPDTVASLLVRMRSNLARLWPNPKVQQQAKTNRSEKELKGQILKGYASASSLCEQAITKHPESWVLGLQLAGLKYEASNYRASVGEHPEHLANKIAAMEQLEKTANQYIQTLPLKSVREESVEPFVTWFYGALGSTDLGVLRGHHQPIASGFDNIKAVLATIPEACRERHLASFAKTIDSRLANVGPDLKYRYLDSAIKVIGEHENMEDAVKVFQYYCDLNTEIKLDVYIDGKDEINADQPFGLFVNILHTREIQRESGGFNKYLVNQNNTRAYNYGRPSEDYRDKFEKGARAVLAEHFDIVSLTFHKPKVKVRSTEKPGWTTTPYAYFLLKVKGPEVDMIPSLKIDLDFLDTSGSVILPVASATLPIDATQISKEARPFRDIKLVMTLDDREVQENNQLALEIRAEGKGLIPSLDSLIELPIGGFKIVDTEDRTLQVDELDAESDAIAPVCSHEWRITLEPKRKLPESFEFPNPKVELSEDEESLVLQRYDDVDLVSVASAVPLVGGKASSSAWYLTILAILVIGGIYGYLFLRNQPITEEADVEEIDMPKRITAVTVLSYLENIYEAKSLDSDASEKLSAEISTLRENSFSEESQEIGSSELRKLANKWRQKAKV